MNFSPNPATARLVDAAVQSPSNRVAVGEAIEALRPVAGRRAVDEPVTDAGAATALERVARVALGALPDAERRGSDFASALWLAVSEGVRLADPGRLGEAVAAATRAVEAAPSSFAAWVELGTGQKWSGAWPAAHDAFANAHRLKPADRRVALDLALCATASGQGEVAAGVYRSLGLPATLARGGMPFVAGLPNAEIRLPTAHAVGPDARPDAAVSFEVLTVAALTPSHGVLLSPTFGDGLADAGDVVLWDSAPVSVRDDPETGTPIPCFPMLALLKRGDERRLRFLAREERRGALTEVFASLARNATLVVQREYEDAADSRLVYGKLVVKGDASLEAVRRVFESAQKTTEPVYVAMPALYEALGDSKMAGKAHQAWGGLERTAARRTQA